MTDGSNTPTGNNFMQQDSIQDSMSAVFDKMQEEPASETPAPEPEPKPEEESAEASPLEDGTEAEEKVEAPEPTEEAESKTEDAPKDKDSDNSEQPTEKIPISLSEEVKKNWDEIPDYVRKEIVKREADQTKFIQKNSEFIKHSQAIRNLEAPYQAMMQALKADPITAYQDHLNTAYILNSGTPQQKADLIQKTINAYGVQLPSQKSSDDDWDFDSVSTDPKIEELTNQVNQLTQMLNSQQQNDQLMQQSSADKVISDFRADPKHKYFDEVNPLMQSMLQSGAAKDLSEAYDMATMAHPSVRTSVLAEKAKAGKEAKRKDAQKKSEAAKKVAGTNLRSKGGNVSLQQERAQVKRGAMPDFSKTMASVYDSLIDEE